MTCEGRWLGGLNDLREELTGRITTLEGRVSSLESKVEALQVHLSQQIQDNFRSLHGHPYWLMGNYYCRDSLPGVSSLTASSSPFVFGPLLVHVQVGLDISMGMGVEASLTPLRPLLFVVQNFPQSKDLFGD